MDEDIMSLLQKKVANIQEEIEYRQAQLGRKEYFLLVAGKWQKEMVLKGV